jgi:site-specific DNA recombinase
MRVRGGAQKRYEDRVKAAKKAEIDAKKDAIRAEDMARGVYTPVGKLPRQEPQRAAQVSAV